MSFFSRFTSRLKPLFAFFLVNLVLLSLSRLGLSLWQAERVSEVNGWIPLLLQGIRVDIATLCWLSALPVILISVLPFNRFVQLFLRTYFVAFSVFLLFMEITTPPFIDTYDFRPNRLFVEYLIHPKEVFSMLATGHTLAFVITPLLTALLTFLFWKGAKRFVPVINTPRMGIFSRIGFFLVTGILVFIGARSSFEHRAMNPAMVAFSSDALVNSLVLNSGYSLGFAVSQMRNESNAAELYGKMSTEEMLSLIKDAQGRDDTDYRTPSYPTVAYHHASYQGKPKNLVIILEESLGAQFIGALGDKRGLSPNIDALSKEGWWFNQLYATGTRSVRGIEAVITGFTPTPARAVVKLPLSQQGFFTIADLLRDQGYNTSFIYGGEKHFDNMASFFYGNGFETIIDQNDYPNPDFKATWGVSDEDLFKKAHQTFEQLAKQDKPFFSLVFSSSNHDPFEFPDGKIELFDKDPATRNNAAKYADFAVGEFFKLAKNANYWDNTIFLIIADHDSRVAGASLVPVQHFHIPALILGKDIPSRQDNRLVSQIDMPPTLLSLIGINASTPMLGYDLTQNINPNRSFMQFDKTFSYRVGDEMVLLQPKSEPKGYRYDKTTHQLTSIEVSEKMKKTALAYALWGSYAYRNHLYPSVETIKSTPAPLTEK